tara:strand:- start:293 stop:532 length:240 start_codon:yes stop_codon:yes gene_type:complete
MLKQENEQQVEAFLARNTQYRLVPIKDAWPEEAVCPSEGNYMRLSPMRHGTDGFFAAVLERIEVNEGESSNDDEDDFFE